MSGSILECRTDLQYRAAVANAGDKLIAVEFYANWSEPSLNVSAALQAASEEFLDLEVLRINSDLSTELLLKYKVSVIPTVQFFKNGIFLHQILGAHASSIREFIKNNIE